MSSGSRPERASGETGNGILHEGTKLCKYLHSDVTVTFRLSGTRSPPECECNWWQTASMTKAFGLQALLMRL